MIAAVLTFLLATPVAATPQTTIAEVDQCIAWLHARPARAPINTAATKVISPRTVCFDGEIFPWTVKDLEAWLDVPAKRNGATPRLVVRSTGGDAGTGVRLAGKLQTIGAETTIVDYCMSSCSNYFFAAVSRRRLANDAVILFHGTFTQVGRASFEALLDRTVQKPQMAKHIADPATWRAKQLKYYDDGLAGQDAAFRRVGTDPAIGDLIDRVDATAFPAAACGLRPSSERAQLIFDVDQLARLGIRIEWGRPLTDPREVDERLAKLGISSTACAVPTRIFDTLHPVKPTAASG